MTVDKVNNKRKPRMPEKNNGKQASEKNIIIHLGPHKTGTTSIQTALDYSRDSLAAEGISYLHDDNTHAIAKALCDKNFEVAAKLLKKLSKKITDLPNDKFLLSDEDFSGHFPGRASTKRVYPTLVRNLQVISRNLAPHHVRFVFVVREQGEWLQSCYGQIIRYRHKYSSYENYAADIQLRDWNDLLSPVKDFLKEDIIVVPYKSEVDAGLRSILNIYNLNPESLGMDIESIPQKNTRLSDEEIFIYERINASAFMREMIPIYKKRASHYLSGKRPALPQVGQEAHLNWPPKSLTEEFIGLEKLTERVQRRVGDQEEQADLLPALDVDLRALAIERLPREVKLPEVSRRKMEDQYRILEYHLRGNSKLAFINALLISYLRRGTPHTEKCRKLFHRIWEEAGLFLVTELSTRWILSTLHTFMDHPKTMNQKVIGAAGYFYGNMLKIYEAERAIEGRKADEIYSELKPSTPSGFRGLDRFNVGGTDLMLNTNAMALELAALDSSAGIVLEELLLRTKYSKTVFSRSDSTRDYYKINTPPFLDCWSFFEEPDRK